MLLKCKCGKSEMFFKYDIGETFVNKCCKMVAKEVKPVEVPKAVVKSEDKPEVDVSKEEKVAKPVSKPKRSKKVKK